jgi:hypothetical protein
MHSSQQLEAQAARAPVVRGLKDVRIVRWILSDRTAFLATFALCAAYVIFFTSLHSVPLQDYPNHLARAAVLADLLFDGGARYGSAFGAQLAPIPYVLHDLVFATLIQVFGTQVGAQLFTTIVLLSLPASLLFYMHVMRVPRPARLTIVTLSLFLATDWFFLMAFLGFRLALALVVVSLALAEKVRERWSPLAYAAYLSVLVAGYLTHLSAPVFFLVTIGVSAAVRLLTDRSTFSREMTLVLPVLTLLAAHVVLNSDAASTAGPAVFTYEWGRLADKFILWAFEFRRFGGHSSTILMSMLGACVLLGVLPAIRKASWRDGSWKSPLFVEQLFVALAFIAVYIVLPQEYSDSAYVDVRALSMVTLFLVIAALWLSIEAGRSGFGHPLVLGFALFVSTANLVWIARHVTPLERWFTRYREMVAEVPVGARVLPVATRSRVGAFNPFLHAGSFLVTDRAVVAPYLFSRTRGDAMKYFYYRDRPYTPQENWYPQAIKWRKAVPATYTVMGQDYTWRFQYEPRDKIWQPFPLVPIEWPRVACDYDLLLVPRPYDATLLGVNTRLVRRNEVAELLAIDKSACRRERPSRIVRLPSERDP